MCCLRLAPFCISGHMIFQRHSLYAFSLVALCFGMGFVGCAVRSHGGYSETDRALLSHEENQNHVVLGEPWDEGDFQVLPINSQVTSVSVHDPLLGTAQSAIRFYRKHVASQSTDRCPFYISCSHFAEQAVLQHGIVKGVGLFIDRHFFRENKMAVTNYTLRESRIGNRRKLKLDDSLYLMDSIRGSVGK